MKCQDYQIHITLQSYDEIDGAERAALERHLQDCAECTAVGIEQRELDQLLAEDSEVVLPADLLVESRQALSDALDRVAVKRSWWRMPTFAVVLTPMKLLESAALVAMGLALGVYLGHQRSSGLGLVPPSTPEFSSIPSNATVNLRIVKSDPSGMVELAGQVVQPYKLQGNINDRQVRQLLFGALQDASNPGARLNALEALAQQPSDRAVQEGLIYALTQDPVAGIRMKALESLKASAGQEDVQKALVHVLRNDDVPGIRAGAIEALTGVSTADDLAKTIEEVAKDDDNAYVRMMGENMGLRFVGSKK